MNLRKVIIYLTYLALTGYAWGGVTGHAQGFGPTTTRNVSSGSPVSKRQLFEPSVCRAFHKALNAVAWDSEGGSKLGAMRINGPCSPVARILGGNPRMKFPSEGSSGTPVNVLMKKLSGMGTGLSILQPALVNVVDMRPEKPHASSSYGWYQRIAVPVGLSLSASRNTASSRERGCCAFLSLATSRLASAVACSAFAALPNACAARSLASAVAFTASEIRSFDSICSLFADLAIKIPIATSPNTPSATIAPPIGTRDGIRRCRTDCQNSGPDSSKTPTTTISPKITNRISRAPNPRPILGLLVGPFIRRRRSYEPRMLDWGAVCIVVALAAIVMALVWFLGSRLS